MTVAGIVLAAGAGRRFGAPKALALFAGETLGTRAVRTLADGGCAPVIVVVGAEAARIRDAIGPLATVVVNAAWEEGLATSLRAGLEAAAATPALAAVVALVDQPLVTPQAVARLVAAGDAGVTAAVATYAGRPRNPALFARSVWADVAASAEGDAGARAWLRSHPASVTTVECGDVAAPDDVDTVGDLERLASRRAP